MALPAGVQTRRITFGSVMDFQGNPLDVTVSFTPSTPLIHTASGTPLIPLQLQIETDANGNGSVTLPATDQAGFSDGRGNTITNWTYRVAWQYPQGVTTPAPINIQVPSGGGDIDLDLLIPVAASGGVTVSEPVVTTLVGQYGDITLAELLAMIEPGLDPRYLLPLAVSAARPAGSQPLWVGGDATTPPANAVAGDIWIHG